MDLRHGREDEAFRAEVRAWLEVEVAAHGPPPAPDDWSARRAYDTAWQRESHFCEIFLDEALAPVASRVGEENDGWRIANVTLRFERGTAFAQHIITMRMQVRRLASLVLARRVAGAVSGDDARRRIGRLYANVEALWRMTQMCIAEAERSGAPSPLGSAIKLRYSELSQEITELALRVVGRPILGSADLGEVRTGEIVREYLWSLQATIAAGTSQIQRNLIAQRILGMPEGR